MSPAALPWEPGTTPSAAAPLQRTAAAAGASLVRFVESQRARTLRRRLPPRFLVLDLRPFAVLLTADANDAREVGCFLAGRNQQCQSAVRNKPSVIREEKEGSARINRHDNEDDDASVVLLLASLLALLLALLRKGKARWRRQPAASHVRQREGQRAALWWWAWVVWPWHFSGPAPIIDDLSHLRGRKES
ncbi:uncharacterized protein K452DRAFT_295657 [Aplosporella prunicola CBS 121167]|uniref:Uncharacterized protein n=1 Tax=Aplosporella prunicola CBS 121167 TaxID=1176127 RepID=A0A6A6BN38_9PEZI|nr:uncharacterized protein K452DRAFT_295657 [Aplosporella prunicola CBS 121167]KAF2145108.1 hypothetical protein K452DRAFT_295657 [Aplosporella prunicola CBS 121167]